MKKLLALLLLSPLVVSEENVISIVCSYEEGSQTKIPSINKWATLDFADNEVIFKIMPSKKIATINDYFLEYFAEVKPSEITISTRIALLEGDIQDVGELMGHYEYIKINRGSGLLSVKNYTKQEENEIADNYPLSVTREYNCMSLKF